MCDGEKRRIQRAWRFLSVPLSILIWTALASIIISEGETWAKARDLVATPVLMGSPLQVIESRMRSGQLQRFESRMLNSPLQLIGSPFGPYRFATLPNFQELWATRQSLSIFPAMLQARHGMLLLLPYYVIPLTSGDLAIQSDTMAEEPPATQPQPIAKSKFISARCGTFMEILVPPGAQLSDEESKPC